MNPCFHCFHEKSKGDPPISRPFEACYGLVQEHMTVIAGCSTTSHVKAGTRQGPPSNNPALVGGFWRKPEPLWLAMVGPIVSQTFSALFLGWAFLETAKDPVLLEIWPGFRGSPFSWGRATSKGGCAASP